MIAAAVNLPEWVERDELVKAVVAIGILVAAGIVVRLVNRALRKAYWRRLVRQSPTQADELRKSKRQQTVLTLVESIIRYAVYGAAVVMALGVVSAGATSAIFGASLLVVLVGFGLQRLLGDMVAGALLLFEGHFAVGDFLHVHSINVAGIVEEFSLRTTTLRTLAGDRIVVLNGNVTAFTRYNNGYRDYRLELVADGEQPAREAIGHVIERSIGMDHARFLLGPYIDRVDHVPESTLVRFELRAVVPPTLEWLAENSLTAQLEAELGTRLVGSVQAYTISERAFTAYRKSVLIVDDPMLIESPATE